MNQRIKISVIFKKDMPVNVFASQAAMLENILPQIIQMIQQEEMKQLKE